MVPLQVIVVGKVHRLRVKAQKGLVLLSILIISLI